MMMKLIKCHKSFMAINKQKQNRVFRPKFILVPLWFRRPEPDGKSDGHSNYQIGPNRRYPVPNRGHFLGLHFF